MIFARDEVRSLPPESMLLAVLVSASMFVVCVVCESYLHHRLSAIGAAGKKEGFQFPSRSSVTQISLFCC
jgi:hypothetical protein